MRKDILKEFAEKHNMELVTQEAGFGEIVTGFIPKHSHMFISIDGGLAKTKPKSAYQHCDILAIKGSGVKAKEELVKWIEDLNQKNVQVKQFKNVGRERHLEENGRTQNVLTTLNNGGM